MINRIKLIAILILFFCSIFYSGYLVFRYMNKALNRQENNNKAMYEQLYNQNKESIGSLILTNKELKSQYNSLYKQIDSLNIKLKNVKSISNVNTETKYKIYTTLNDSTINDTTTIQCAKYNDKWIDYDMCYIGDSILTNIETRDSLIIIQHYNKRSFIQWLTFKKKTQSNLVKSFNPNSRITYNRNIIIKKHEKD